MKKNFKKKLEYKASVEAYRKEILFLLRSAFKWLLNSLKCILNTRYNISETFVVHGKQWTE